MVTETGERLIKLVMENIIEIKKLKLKVERAELKHEVNVSMLHENYPRIMEINMLLAELEVK